MASYSEARGLSFVEKWQTEQQRDQAQALPRQIDIVVLDFDGVFTDNTVTISETGQESVICSREDSLGLALFKRESDIPVIVVSTETNAVVQVRCNKLGIKAFDGVGDKKAFLSSYLADHKLSADNALYVGNDINDLDCIKMVGCGVAVGDAHPDIISAAKLRLCNHGGHGALRECFDLVRYATRDIDRQGDT